MPVSRITVNLSPGEAMEVHTAALAHGCSISQLCRHRITSNSSASGEPMTPPKPPVRPSAPVVITKRPNPLTLTPEARTSAVEALARTIPGLPRAQVEEAFAAVVLALDAKIARA